jgi:hypothetical protein
MAHRGRPISTSHVAEPNERDLQRNIYRIQLRTSLCRKQIAQTVERTGSSDPLPFARVHHGAQGKELFEVEVDVDVFQCLSKGCEHFIGQRVEELWPDQRHVTGSCRFDCCAARPFDSSPLGVTTYPQWKAMARSELLKTQPHC